MTNAKIVVAHPMRYVRDRIAGAKDPTSDNHLYLTGDPAEVIHLVSTEDIAAIVTGQYFCPGFMSYLRVQPTEDIPRDGCVLAKRVMELSPKTLIFRYSLSSPRAFNVLDGDIPRGRGPYYDSVLVDLIGAEELGELAECRDFMGLRRRFPNIIWYPR